MDFRYPTSVCVFLSVICVAFAAQAASPWTDTQVPSGATIQVMAKSGRGTLLAGTSFGYLFRSTDGGETWERTWGTRTSTPPRLMHASGDSLILVSYSFPPNPLFDCFCIKPSTSMALLDSRDDGMTWTATIVPGGVFALNPGPQGTLLAAGMRIHISSPGKMDWKPLAFGFSGNRPETHYPFWTAMTSVGSTLIGIYDSLPYFANYSPDQDSVTFSKLMDINSASLYASGSSLFVSTSKGLFLFQGIGIIDVAIKFLIDTSKVMDLMEADSGYLIGKSGNRLRRGKAQRGTWQPWGPELPAGAQAMVWQDKAVIAGGTLLPQPLRSVSESPWAGFGTGVSEFFTDPLLATREAVYAWTFQGVMMSRPNGLWSRVDSLGPEKFLTFMSKGNRTLWAGGKSLWRNTEDPVHGHWTVPKGIDPGIYPLNLATTGKHILASHVYHGNEPLNAIFVCPVDGDSCWRTPLEALGKAQLGTSHDPFPISSFTGIGDTILAYKTLLYRSVDGGRTWDTAKAVYPSSYFRYEFLGKRLFAIGYHPDCGTGTCWRYSDDLAETWTTIPNGGPENHRTVDLRVQDGVFFAATDSGVFSSRDGLEWKDLDLPGASPRRLAAGDGLLAIGTDDSRLLIREVESLGLNQVRTVPNRESPGKRIIRGGILVQDARGGFRRMDGKAVEANLH
jgi:hypothetical protein